MTRIDTEIAKLDAAGIVAPYEPWPGAPIPAIDRQENADARALYYAAKAADDAFHRECVRQFGHSLAGTMRYLPAKHDAATRRAAQTFHDAADALRHN